MDVEKNEVKKSGYAVNDETPISLLYSRALFC
jgi:hypothetical protein